jgi:hypothetical protein
VQREQGETIAVHSQQLEKMDRVEEQCEIIINTLKVNRWLLTLSLFTAIASIGVPLHRSFSSM